MSLLRGRRGPALRRRRALALRQLERKEHPAEVRNGACVDYLVGMKLADIAKKWNLKSGSIVSQWIQRSGMFKVRSSRK